MLVITRKDGQGIDFDVNGIKGKILVEDIGRQKFRLLIDAPPDFHVVRSELVDFERKQSVAAVG